MIASFAMDSSPSLLIKEVINHDINGAGVRLMWARVLEILRNRERELIFFPGRTLNGTDVTNAPILLPMDCHGKIEPVRCTGTTTLKYDGHFLDTFGTLEFSLRY
eukprot:1083641_1